MVTALSYALAIVLVVVGMVEPRIVQEGRGEAVCRDSEVGRTKLAFSSSLLRYRWPTPSLEEAVQSQMVYDGWPPAQLTGCEAECEMSKRIVVLPGSPVVLSPTNRTVLGRERMHLVECALGAGGRMACSEVFAAHEGCEHLESQTCRAAAILNGSMTHVILLGDSLAPPRTTRSMLVTDAQCSGAMGLALLCAEPECLWWVDHWVNRYPLAHRDSIVVAGWSRKMWGWIPMECGLLNALRLGMRVPPPERNRERDPFSVAVTATMRGGSRRAAVASFVSNVLGEWRGQLLGELTARGVPIEGYGSKGPSAPEVLRVALKQAEAFFSAPWREAGGAITSTRPGKLLALRWYVATLALENSAIPDYVTEKVLEAVLAGVPVIAAASAENLGEYLHPWQPHDDYSGAEQVVFDITALGAGRPTSQLAQDTHGTMRPVDVVALSSVLQAGLTGFHEGGNRGAVRQTLEAIRAINPGPLVGVFTGRVVEDSAPFKRCRDLGTMISPPRPSDPDEQLSEWLRSSFWTLDQPVNSSSTWCRLCSAVRSAAACVRATSF
jgi:hypothetical protein